MMPYTYKSLAVAWLLIFALFAVSVSGIARGGWFVLLVAVVTAVPALVLRTPVHVATTSAERPLAVEEDREESATEVEGIDPLGWENEGGAGRLPARDWARNPASVGS